MGKVLTKLPPKSRFAAILALSSGTSFMILLFTPLDLYLNSPSYFLVSVNFFLPTLLLFFVALAAAIATVLLLLWYGKTLIGVVLLLSCGVLVAFARFVLGMFMTIHVFLFCAIALSLVLWVFLSRLQREKAVDIVMLVIWGAYVASYIQILFLNGSMAVITGDRAAYDALDLGHIINMLIWVVVTMLPLSLWMILKSKKIGFKFDKVLIITVIVVSGMQITGLVSTAVTAVLPAGYDDEDLMYLSYEHATSLSSDDNVILFILDRFDVKYMGEVLELYPELYDKLDGFTYYENNIAEFTGTFPAVTKMMTQHYYREEMTFEEYWDEAWAQHTIIDTLRENGFKTNLFIDRMSTYGKLSNIVGRADNLVKTYSVIEVHPLGILNTLGRLSLGRSAPYLLKNLFLAPIDAAFGTNLFYDDTYDAVAAQPPVVGVGHDIKFFEYIKRKEFLPDSDKKVFVVIHFNCSHADWDRNVHTGGYFYDEESGTIEKGGNFIESTRACFEILDLYFKNMKEIGVYDNSTIIMVGDHGAGQPGGGNKAITTGLLIKPRGASGTLETDNKAELSDKYLGASILEAAGIARDHLGISYFDIIGGAPPPVRVLYPFASWWEQRGGAEKITIDGIYEIRGDANDFENWTFIPK